MGSKEKIAVCLSIRIMKKLGLLNVLKKIAEKTENEVDDMVVNALIGAIDLADQVICQGKPIEEIITE